MAEIRVLGIRHHGPGSARSVRGVLDTFDPEAVLIEGPADADPMLSWVGELQPPVALLGWRSDEPGRSAFWPFAVFSPEWQAMVWAAEHGRAAQFIDLPTTNVLALEDKDDEGRAGQHTGDPLALLASAGGYDDPERWWEDLVEQRKGDVFDAITEAMAAVREDGVSEYNAIREAHMRRMLRAAARQYQRIAVVCGAFHAPALTGKMPPASADSALLRGLPKVASQTTWVPWSHGRLALRSGYGAGVESPGWYHHLFTASDEPIARWFIHISAVLRDHDLQTSSAHAIEGVRLADTLAALRGRPMPGLAEVQEATLAVLCEGSEIALHLVTREAVVGEMLGQVPDGVPRTPIEADLLASMKRLRLKMAALPRELNLDLRKENDLARSHLLRRLSILDIAWGEQRSASSTGTFRETWTIEWRPELAVSVVDAARWGNTVKQAAASKLLASTETLAQITSGVEKALAADLGDALPDLLGRLDVRAAAETDICQMLEALGPLVRSYRYGDVRGTDVRSLGQVIEVLLGRACAGLPVALGGIAPDAAAELRDLIDRTNGAIGLLDDAAADLWHETLRTALERRDLNGLIAGRLVRLLFDAGQIDIGQVRQRLSLALSGGHPPAEQGPWVEGLLTGSSLLLLHNPALLRVIDDWVRGLAEEAFVEILPVVRRAFGAWDASERRALATRVAQLDEADIPEHRETGLQDAAEILATVNLILEAAR